MHSAILDNETMLNMPAIKISDFTEKAHLTLNI